MLKMCPRCGTYLQENESCDCVSRELLNKMEYEFRYAYHPSSAPKNSNDSDPMNTKKDFPSD